MAKEKLNSYYNNKTKLDCADLALSVLVDYASEEGLPLKLFSSSGDVYDSASDDYNSVEDYKNGSKETSGVLSLSAQDIHVNTQIIDKKIKTARGSYNIDKTSKSYCKCIRHKPNKIDLWKSEKW